MTQANFLTCDAVFGRNQNIKTHKTIENNYFTILELYGDNCYALVYLSIVENEIFG